MKDFDKILNQFEFLSQKVKPIFDELPELIQNELILLKNYYKQYKDLVELKPLSSVEKRVLISEWFKITSKVVKKCFNYLKFIDKKLLDYYFYGEIPSKQKTPQKMYGMLLVLIEATKHPHRRDLDQFLNELNLCSLEGYNLLSPEKSLMNIKKNKNNIKDKYNKKYTTIKYYFKAFFNESTIDYHTFFID